MTVRELPAHLKEHWPAIHEQLLSGTYRPQPVKRVEISKPDGGVRKMGIPTVLHRVTGLPFYNPSAGAELLSPVHTKRPPEGGLFRQGGG